MTCLRRQQNPAAGSALYARPWNSGAGLAEPKPEYGIDYTFADAGKGLDLSFGVADAPRSVEEPPGKRSRGIQVEATPIGPMFVRRPEPAGDRSRYEVVGYPKAPRAGGGAASHASPRDPGRAQQRRHNHNHNHNHRRHASAAAPVPAQPELRGFEVRVIDTHGGKAVVRTPILSYACEADLPSLPPLNAAERRYNAQRALINTTSVLRSVVGAKDQPERPAGRARAASFDSDADRISAHGGPRRKTDAGGFQINMSFDPDGSQAAAGPARRSGGGGGAPDRTHASGTLADAPSGPGGVLERWGIPAAPPRTPTTRARASSGYDSDGTTRGPAHSGALRTHPARASSVVLSDESQQLIDSVFGGRLSIDSGVSGSRCESATFATDSSATHTLMTPPPPPQANDLPYQEPAAASSRPRFGSAWTQASQSPRLRAQEPGERDGSKMRKPSFWSIFRGGSGRKDADDDKKDPSSAAGRAQILRKQQSTSSGFADTIGFSKRQCPADARVGAVAQAYLLTNKALPPSPRPTAPEPQQQDQKPLPIITGLAKSTADCRVVCSTAPDDRHAAAAVPARSAASAEAAPRPSSASGHIDGMQSDPPAAAMPFAPYSAADSGTGGLRASAAALRTLNSSIDSTMTTGDPRITSDYYESMDHIVPLTAAVNRLSQQNSLAEGSLPDALKRDSVAADLADGDDLVPSDTESDLVPLYRPHILAERDSRSGLGLDMATGGGGSATGGATPNTDAGDASASPPTGSPAEAGGAKPPAALARGSRAPSLDSVTPSGRMRFSPNNPARLFASDQPQEASASPASAPAAPSDPAPDGDDEDDGAAEAAPPRPAFSSSDAEDNATLARAMGQYLYDLEGHYCEYYSGLALGRKAPATPRPADPEPARPEILRGVGVPALVDHAEWLGKREIFNALTLRYYIACYDFSGLRIDECLRRLCSHIFLRGESQVIDRLLVALAQRYIECNPDTRLLSADVAHAVTYSTLLLNTDLHIADIRSIDRMTRSRFVRNTIDTIAQFQCAVAPVAPPPEPAAEDAPLWSPPPQLPELDLSKQPIDSAHPRSGSFAADAEAAHSAGPRAPETAQRAPGSPADVAQGRSSEPSTLRSLVGSMTQLAMQPAGSTVPRSSRDVVRLMGGRGKRFSFFDGSSSAAGTGGSSSLAVSATTPSAVAAAVAAAAAASQPPASAPAAAAAAAAASSPSSLRAFDRLRRKVSTNGAHGRSRSGTVSMEEAPVVANSRTSISGASHHSAQRDLAGRAAGATSAMPNLAELTSILKDVYTGIKNKPLGQPLFARQANVLYNRAQQQQQQQQQRLSSTPGPYDLERGSHELHHGRTSLALAHSGKPSLEIDPTALAHGRAHPPAPHTAYLDYDSHSSVGTGGRGRPSSARSVPLHSVQRTQSITSMNVVDGASAAGQAAMMAKRPPQHPDLRIGMLGAEATRRSGSSMINFGGSAGGGVMRSSASSASMGMGYMPSPGYASYLRSPIENQHMRSGVLVRKHLFERAGKKASHRAWRTCYVSVDRGTVAMYKMDGRHGGHPDGRELTDTSLQLGSVSLRHTMTHMLPPPGYSRSRPHVFALQLPSGGVYLFQTASEVELRDWVAACNYWAARESKAPYMIGGVYNMEYGWDNTGDFALRFDEREAREDRGEQPSPVEVLAVERRIVEEREASRGANILEWAPPNNPMQRSDLDEAAQLKALLHHIAYLEEELVAHKKVQGSIEERFFPKTQQFQRAFSNWERKAQYILQELIKYQSYADVLQRTLKQLQEEATPPIPEETGGENSSTTTVAGNSAPRDEGEEAARSGGGHAPPAAQMSPAVPSGSSGGRRATDSYGQSTPSKALPIKELLAPTSDKARQRASIIAQAAPQASSPAAGGSPLVN